MAKGVGKGRKAKRRTYDTNDAFTLKVPNYLDDITLNWLNSQAQVATSIWELVRKAAHNEMLQSNPAAILQALGLPLDKIELTTKENAMDSLIKSKNNINDNNKENNKPIIQDKALEETAASLKVNEEKLISKDKNVSSNKKEEASKVDVGIKGLDLNQIALKKKGSTPLSRTDKGISSLPSGKPNPIETETLGTD